MDLYFLRHGDAGDARAWKGDDSARPLTAAGKEQVKRVASAIATLDLGIDLVVSSPFLRANQTAEIAAHALGSGVSLAIDDRLSPGFGFHDLQQVLRENADRKALMLVGHEPDFSGCIAACIGGGKVECGKAALARVQVKDAKNARGSLAWLIPARVLAP